MMNRFPTYRVVGGAAFAALLATVPFAYSGTVKVSGFLDPAPGQLCPQGGAFILRDTAVSITSSTVNLAPFVGKNVTVVGNDLGAPCPVVDALAVTGNSTYLYLCGFPGVGCEVSLDLCPAPSPSVVLMFGSFGTTYLPVNPNVGTFLLDPGTFFQFFAANQAGVCEAYKFKVPGSPALIGLQGFFQAAVTKGIDTTLSNVTSLQVQPQTFCPYFECF